jgi:hypothetical protein
MSAKRALIRLGRIYNAEPELLPGSTYFQRGCMRTLPGRSASIPLVVDHDLTIGVVDELIELNDAYGPWLGARCRVFDPPDWLREGTGAISATRRCAGSSSERASVSSTH